MVKDFSGDLFNRSYEDEDFYIDLRLRNCGAIDLIVR